MDSIPPIEERRELAALIGVDPTYLHQCMTGFRSMKAGDAVDAVRKTGGRLKLWQLRTNDWHRIWPDLIGTEGAPDVPPPEPNSPDTGLSKLAAQGV